MIRIAQGKKPKPELGMPNDYQAVGGGNNDDLPGAIFGGEGAGGEMNAMGDPNAAIDRYNDAAYKNWDKNILEPCPHCARTFLPDSLKFHLKACTAERPLKKKLIRPGEEGYEESLDFEKKPALGLAARQAAEEKAGRFASPSPDKKA